MRKRGKKNDRYGNDEADWCGDHRAIPEKQAICRGEPVCAEETFRYHNGEEMRDKLVGLWIWYVMLFLTIGSLMLSIDEPVYAWITLAGIIAMGLYPFAWVNLLKPFLERKSD